MTDVRYEIENPEIQRLLLELAKRLDADIPKGWGFTLLMFEFTPGNSLFYISSAQRPDMIKTMREFIQKQTLQ